MKIDEVIYNRMNEFVSFCQERGIAEYINFMDYKSFKGVYNKLELDKYQPYNIAEDIAEFFLNLMTEMYKRERYNIGYYEKPHDNILMHLSLCIFAGVEYIPLLKRAKGNIELSPRMYIESLAEIIKKLLFKDPDNADLWISVSPAAKSEYILFPRIYYMTHVKLKYKEDYHVAY